MTAVALGLRANAAQFSLLVALNVLVGAMVGLERSVLPLVGERDFGVTSRTALLAFVVAFGVSKALANLATGRLADRAGRRRVLAAGWLLALPVPVLLAIAPSWTVVVLANLLLGASQGLAWSMTVLMKIDLAGPARRGLALGLNEFAGYLGVAATAFATGVLAGTIAPRTAVWTVGLLVAVAGTALSFFARDTRAHVAEEVRAHREVQRDGRTLRACAQAGFVNNLNDAAVWGLVPLALAAGGASAGAIGAVAALYPAVWAVGQVPAGWLSDHVPRLRLVALGMLVQGVGLALLALGELPAAVAGAAVLGAGTALAYPTLLGAVSDAVGPAHRSVAVARYRFWRDSGFVAGALGAGLAADLFGATAALLLVAALTAATAVPLTRRPR